LENPGAATRMAHAALAYGISDATDRLVAMVEALRVKE
ncbi:MAG: UDP-N-acetylglucosamine--N-acetylmuramyl-(pentapeptide) pyrophosphoryl-undecaprenol N-acetylglucosamine transferase, partial [Rhodobacteraceae bacterium]|nr:UDP-N-acetylglucosamine--N-acetylmuramyl-(pentapeptide) pyrophosphoryl-undecaprenol N-acetylglucosamine transferase [Paracoccaceae bacterium]